MVKKLKKNDTVTISTAVIKQVLAAFAVLIIILTGTATSVTADIILRNSELSYTNLNSDNDNTDDNGQLSDDGNFEVIDLTDTSINSINDLIEDNHKLMRRDNLNENGKKIYDGLYKTAANRSSLEYKDNTEYSNERADVLSDIFSDMLAGFILMDHPEIFWCHGSITLQSNELGNKAEYLVSMIYDCDENKVSQYDKAIKNKLDEIVKKVPQGGQYEQALWVHDYIVNNTVYNLNPTWATGKNKDFGGSIYGLLIKNESVCNGYAKTFKYVLDKLNIPCTVISGVSNDGERHAWNIVELDGEYYQVDVTWDDPVGREQVLVHDYFCVTDSKIYESRRADDFISAPQCTLDKYEKSFK